jgi:hypothetical protein
VFFDSDEPGVLPWTTTKTGVDTDHVAYKQVRERLIEATVPVVNFLKNLEKERRDFQEGNLTEERLAEAIEKSEDIQLGALTVPKTFKAPQVTRDINARDLQRIQYSRERCQIQKIMEQEGLRTFKEVGEYTFDYYISMETE